MVHSQPSSPSDPLRLVPQVQSRNGYGDLPDEIVVTVHKVLWTTIREPPCIRVDPFDYLTPLGVQDPVIRVRDLGRHGPTIETGVRGITMCVLVQYYPSYPVRGPRDCRTNPPLPSPPSPSSPPYTSFGRWSCQRHRVEDHTHTNDSHSRWSLSTENPRPFGAVT